MFSGISDTALFVRSIDVLLVDLRVLAVGVAQGDRGRRLLDDQAGEREAVLGLDLPVEVLVGDGLAGIEDRLEQVLAAGLLADHRQVRPDLAADAADRVAFQTLHVVFAAAGEELLAALRVALAPGEHGDGRQLLRVDLARRRERRQRLVVQVADRGCCAAGGPRRTCSASGAASSLAGRAATTAAGRVPASADAPPGGSARSWSLLATASCRAFSAGRARSRSALRSRVKLLAQGLRRLDPQAGRPLTQQRGREQPLRPSTAAARASAPRRCGRPAASLSSAASFATLPTASVLPAGGDQAQARDARLGSSQQQCRDRRRSDPCCSRRPCHLPGRNSFRFSITLSRTSGGTSVASTLSSASPAALSSDAARMSTIRARWAAGSFVGQALLQRRHHDGGRSSQTRSATLSFHSGNSLSKSARMTSRRALSWWPTAMPMASR